MTLSDKNEEAHWIPLYSTDDPRDDQKCSNCGYKNSGATRFYPDCGKRMFNSKLAITLNSILIKERDNNENK